MNVTVGAIGVTTGGATTDEVTTAEGMATAATTMTGATAGAMTAAKIGGAATVTSGGGTTRIEGIVIGRGMMGTGVDATNVVTEGETGEICGRLRAMSAERERCGAHATIS